MRYVCGTLATWLAFTACTDTAPTAVREPAPTASASIVPLDRYGIGQGGRGNACRAAEYRQFDFWVGNWNLNPTGSVGSVVSSVLGGCAVLENFFGGSGRSLNAYDDATGTWNQFFVSSGGGVLMLRGGFRSDSMILSEQQGPVSDVWTWTKLPDGSVKQHEQRLFNGDTIPGMSRTGRRFTYWSNSRRNCRIEPCRET